MRETCRGHKQRNLVILELQCLMLCCYIPASASGTEINRYLSSVTSYSQGTKSCRFEWLSGWKFVLAMGCFIDLPLHLYEMRGANEGNGEKTHEIRIPCLTQPSSQQWHHQFVAYRMGKEVVERLGISKRVFRLKWLFTGIRRHLQPKKSHCCSGIS